MVDLIWLMDSEVSVHGPLALLLWVYGGHVEQRRPVYFLVCVWGGDKKERARGQHPWFQAPPRT